MLYPLIFEPILKEHVWGGRNLDALYGKHLPPGALVGESWEISDRPEGVSVIANGPLAGKNLRWLMEQHGAELMGDAPAQKGRFPLLAKILDCQQPPSIQVHPPEGVAARHGGEPKTELWYITQAKPDAELFVGLKPGVRRAQFERKTGDGSVADCLHQVPVKAGDAMFVPSGRVHSLGAGVVAFEFQENSDTTYRVFDWNRRDAAGKPRELHTAKALDAIDFDDVTPTLVPPVFEDDQSARVRSLAANASFDIEECQAPAGYRQSLGPLDRPLILSVAAGKISVSSAAAGVTVALQPGRFCLLPASVDDAVVTVDADATYLLAGPGVKADQADEAEPAGRLSASAATPSPRAQGTRRRSHASLHRRSLPSRRMIKRDLSKRLIYSPFLKMLVLLFWFRVVVLSMAAVGLLAALMLPRVWKATPSGFSPVVRISLLDKVQSIMLSRTGNRELAARNYEASFGAWRSAYANNRGDAEIARGMLRCIAAPDPVPDNWFYPGVQVGEWLLRLTQTNRADLELVCSFYDKAQLYDFAGSLLKPLAGELSGKLRSIYVKALFFQADFREYDALWKQLSPAEQATPEMALIRAGYLTGWGQSADVEEAKKLLRTAAGERGPVWLLANRLEMGVSSSRMDLPSYLAALQRLQDAQLDNARDNTTYWLMLAAAGQKEEAVRLASGYASPPRTPSDLVQLTRVNRSLDLKDPALKLMRAFANTFALSEVVWTLYAALLEEAKDWEGLRGAALHMRRFPIFRGSLDALSHYYEGQADLATGRKEAAERAFNAAADSDFQSPAQSIFAATALLKQDYPRQARSILERAEGTFGTNRVEFLELMTRAAIRLKDGPLLLRSSEAIHELVPGRADYTMSYAAALLIEGSRPEQALTLTRGLLERFPDSNPMRVNAALALLMNARPDDAKALLDQTLVARLRLDEINSYFQALFEYYAVKEEYDKAWSMLDRVDRDQLFPAERDRLDKMRAKLPPRRPPPAA